MKSTALVFVLMLITALSCLAQKQKVPPPAPSFVNGEFDITIEHNGNKTEIKSTQFQNSAGFFLDNESGLLTIGFRADNDKDERKISINGRLPRAAAGTYPLGIGEGTALFNIETSEFPKALFYAKSGSIDISNMPLAGGVINGTFNEICEVGTDDSDKLETYTVSGTFKFRRGPAIR